MRITLEADYAIRMIDCLTNCKERLCAKTLSGRTGVSLRFALKILRKLCAADLICSYKGLQGGYELKRNPDEINLKDVIEAIDGPIQISRCQNDNICSMVGNPESCAYHGIFSDIADEVGKKLSTVTFNKK